MSISEMEAEIIATEDAIKVAMGNREQITAGAYKITWKPVSSSRLDGAALRKELPEIADKFLKTSTVRRFCVI